MTKERNEGKIRKKNLLVLKVGVAQDEEEKDGVGKEKIGSEVEENLSGLLSNDFKY